MKIVKTEQPTFVVSLAVHKKLEENELVRLRCRHLLPIEGYPYETRVLPIGGYVYDHSKDSYIINCVDYLALGFIPFSCKLEMDGVGQWNSYVPLSLSIIRQNLELSKKKEFEKFRNKYDKNQVDFQNIQFISSF
ncbi:MAG: hypothetical protein DWQ19_10650 [Crenarchaeota archaeon]|nr:MAG: hypothetical protein DWQ19_10650 [Thermoproteota archaeon]